MKWRKEEYIKKLMIKGEFVVELKKEEHKGYS